MAMITVNGARLGYDEAGQGPPVVFSHAAMADRRLWDDQFAALSATHRVIRYDWRGYGESGDAAGEFSHHRDLLGLLDALDVQRAALVGCSMGGAHCLDVALAAPDRVASLALIGSWVSGHPFPDDMVAAARAQVHSAVPADRLSAYAARRADVVRAADVTAMAEAQARFMVVGPDRQVADLDPRVWRAAVEMLELVFRREWSGPAGTDSPPHPPAVGRLAQVRVPVLVINGLSDVPWVQQVADMLVTGLPAARRLDLPDTGHLPPLERPEAVTAALVDFLSTAW